MYLRMIRPLPLHLDGFDLRRFVLHGAYDVAPPLSEFLVVSGYASPATPAPSHDPVVDAMAGALITPTPFDRGTAARTIGHAPDVVQPDIDD